MTLARRTERSTDSVCFVEGTATQLFDASGAPIAQRSEYIERSLAYAERLDMNLPACLAGNGGFGYFSSIIPAVEPHAVASVAITMDVSDAREDDAPQGELVPIAYSANS